MHPYFYLHLIKIIIVLALIFTGVFMLLRYYMKHNRKQITPASTNESQKIILPLRLQAYERIVLFLERIFPSTLILRLNKQDLSSAQLQSLLVKTIRDEFEYNLSQQIYISSTSWELIKNAKEETIRLINQAAGKVKENTPSSESARIILEISLEKEKNPINLAIEELKKEVRNL